jgi:hypothetical protein
MIFYFKNNRDVLLEGDFVSLKRIEDLFLALVFSRTAKIGYLTISLQISTKKVGLYFSSEMLEQTNLYSNLEVKSKRFLVRLCLRVFWICALMMS